MRLVDAYYSNELRCWVRMERQVDGEWCHTSGYATKEEAVK
jgi:cytochrome c biogenesis protein ResB